MSIKLPATIVLPPVPKKIDDLFGLHGYFMQVDSALKNYAKNVYNAMTYLTRSKSFTTSDWTAQGEYYTFTFNHNLDLSQTLISVYDTAMKEVKNVDIRVIDGNTIEIKTDTPFSGQVVVIGI